MLSTYIVIGVLIAMIIMLIVALTRMDNQLAKKDAELWSVKDRNFKLDNRVYDLEMVVDYFTVENQRLIIKNRIQSGNIQDLNNQLEELRIEHAKAVLGGTWVDELAARREMDQA